MTDIVRFTAVGLPVAKGSMRAVGRGRMTNANPKTAEWQALVAHFAAVAMTDQVPFDEPVSVELIFGVARPKSAPKRVLFPATRPDLDKLARCVLDAMTGVIYRDDALIVDLDCSMRFAVGRPPGVRVVVAPVARPVPANPTLDNNI
jgi:crossover junction endodeoxyribonuclease RusA